MLYFPYHHIRIEKRNRKNKQRGKCLFACRCNGPVPQQVTAAAAIAIMSSCP